MLPPAPLSDAPASASAPAKPMVDILAEYCGLAGGDAQLKRQATGLLLSLLGRGRGEQGPEDMTEEAPTKMDAPPTMRRMYRLMAGRSLRIFLSSTFRDMNDERSIFTKRCCWRA